MLIETNAIETRHIFSDLVVTKLLDEAPDDEENPDGLNATGVLRHRPRRFTQLQS